MKSNRDKHREMKARWKHAKRGRYPGHWAVRGLDHRGRSAVDVFPAPVGTQPTTTTISFSKVTGVLVL